jgi:hypothetical protein
MTVRLRRLHLLRCDLDVQTAVAPSWVGGYIPVL